MQLTIVCMSAVFCDGRLLAEMSDGSLLDLPCPEPAPQTTRTGWYTSKPWAYKTAEELRQYVADRKREIRRAEEEQMYRANMALHDDKVRRLGQDYARRGY